MEIPDVPGLRVLVQQFTLCVVLHGFLYNVPRATLVTCGPQVTRVARGTSYGRCDSRIKQCMIPTENCQTRKSGTTWKTEDYAGIQLYFVSIYVECERNTAWGVCCTHMYVCLVVDGPE